MKRLLPLLLILLTVPLSAQRMPVLKGNRQVERFAERLDFFREVVLEGELEVELLPGITNRLELEADDNIRDVLSMQVRDEVLYIDLFYRIKRAKSLKLKVFYTELDHITVKMGKVTVPEVLISENLVLRVGDRCSLALKANVNRAEVRLEGSGRLDLNVDAEALLLEASGNSQSRIYTNSGESRFRLEESATVQLEGKGKRAELTLMGNSTFRAFSYTINVCDVFLDENAQADLWVMDELNLRSQGKGRVEFYGEPHIQIERFLNQSQLIRREQK